MSVITNKNRSANMADSIIHNINALPESIKFEVVDFMEFLKVKYEVSLQSKEDSKWFSDSLASAMRGMENEEELYSFDDLKVTFK